MPVVYFSCPTEIAEYLVKRKDLWEAPQLGEVVPVESKRDDGKWLR
tara:strand:- start:2567 stop:2704 length:138 start_codon:yes stop_codon:yes gene_type:complete